MTDVDVCAPVEKGEGAACAGAPHDGQKPAPVGICDPHLLQKANPSWQESIAYM